MSDLTNVFDVAKNAEQGAFLHLENPTTREPLYTEDGKAVGIDLIGVDSARFRQVEKRILNAYLANPKKAQKGMTAEKIELQSAEKLAACVIKCHNVVFGGEEMTAKNAEDFLVRYPALFEQVDDFVRERQNFSKA